MSVNISKNEYLMHLIYNHLKENGFQNAADELQKHAPQLEPRPLSTSLLEIYDKWFSDFILETGNAETTQGNTLIGVENHESYQKSSRGKHPTSAPVKAKRQPKDTSREKKIQSQENDAMNTTNHVPADDCSSMSAEESQSLLPQTLHPLKLILKSPSKLLVAASPRKGTQMIVPLETTISGGSSESTGVSSDSQEETPATKATLTAKGFSKAALKVKAKPAQDGQQANSTPVPVKAQKSTPKSKTKAIPSIPSTPVLAAKPSKPHAAASSATPKPTAAASKESSDSSSDSSDSSLDSGNDSEATPIASEKPLGTAPTLIKAKVPLTAKTSAKASKQSVSSETCSDTASASLDPAAKKKHVAEPPITPKEPQRLESTEGRKKPAPKKASRKTKASTVKPVLTAASAAKAADKTIRDIASREEPPAVAPTNPAVATPKEKKGTTMDKVKPLTRKIQTPKEKAAKPSAKRKKSQDKPGDAVLKRRKKKASVSQTESVMATAPTPPLRDDGSDSDSSLDVEKWKKLALELSDADMAKMDTLDSSAPALKKPRVRKSRTKPPPKATSLSKHTPMTGEKKGESNDTKEENTPLKAKRPRAKKTAPATQAVTIQLEPMAAAEEQLQAATSTPEQDGNPKAKKRKKADVTPGADQSENTLSEPKRKKKKKDMAEKASETADDSATQAAREEKSEEIVKEKKKKKKKDKGGKEAEESVNKKLEEQKGENAEEKIMEERAIEEVNTKETNVKAKNRKNISRTEKESILELTTEIEAEDVNEEKEVKKKKKKKDKGPRENIEDQYPLLQSAPESLSHPSEKKKKKHKSKQPEGLGTPATAIQNSTPEQIPPNSAIDSKKKKKSSKSKDL